MVSINVFLAFLGCIEEFDPQTKSLERLLVINALLTDEHKKHHVRLSRVFSFEEDLPTYETNARVVIVDDLGMEYMFKEEAIGDYVSVDSFAAKEGSTYTLIVALDDGQKFISEKVSTPQKVPISQLRAKRYVNDKGDEGVGILLNNAGNVGDATFFKYEYEETYKIIAPKYDPFEMFVVHYIPCDTLPYRVDIRPRTVEQRTCFATANSTQIIKTSTSDLLVPEVENFEVRFIDKDNYIISHRYSLLVRQFSKTREAYRFYETLGEFSSSRLVFSGVQPGFLEGNIVSSDDPNQKVLGYFEVASVSEERVFFNYQDLFPKEELPPYVVNCYTLGNPPLYTRGYHCDGFRNCDGACQSPLIEGILAGTITFAAENEDFYNYDGPYFTLPIACSDCTALGSNIVPDFWTE